MSTVPTAVTLTAASEDIRVFVGKLQADYFLSSEQVFDLLSAHRMDWFARINWGVTINHNDLGKLKEVLEAMLGTQKGLDCWNKEYAHRLLQSVLAKAPRTR
ncbi:hypothetical protein LCGC14_1299520 [marine sediment metagenome]|uniref:Uncharacterized protein n=1 Tax=marine sediment metagenome TaxID=412755 RepID=A0A0F9LAL9_9ZZZZ